MPAPVPLSTQIVAQVVASLAAIAAGDDYHFTVEQAKRIEWDVEPEYSRQHDTIHLVRVEEGEDTPTASAHHDRLLEMLLTVARKAGLAADAALSEGEIKDRLLEDAKKKLWKDWPGWAFTIFSVRFPETNRDFNVEGWIGAHAVLEITYHEKTR